MKNRPLLNLGLFPRFQEDEKFIVWMRPAALPTFRKLEGRIRRSLKKNEEVGKCGGGGWVVEKDGEEVVDEEDGWWLFGGHSLLCNDVQEYSSSYYYYYHLL